MPTWNDAQYLKFADERTRPSRELLARVPLAAPRTVVDLGCGPGNSTELLARRWPDARVVGVDNSAAMLKRAASDHPHIAWQEADVATWTADEPVDVLFANAVLQWLPEHASLFSQLLKQVAPGGVLAVQMPRNFDEPSHRLMRETPGPWHERFMSAKGAVRRSSPVATPAFYYDLLAPHASRVDLWQTSYEQVMPDAEAIVEWVKGTGLMPYLEALSDDAERARYVDAYRDGIAQAYAVRADGKRLFTFPRLFIVAQV
jgi:trans-aconitate 2-methyltransferase